MKKDTNDDVEKPMSTYTEHFRSKRRRRKREQNTEERKH
jgi:hypothetical protein